MKEAGISPSLKVASLNVGRLFHPHADASKSFLMRPDWDIICVQDVPEYFVSDGAFKSRWPIQHFVAMTNHLIGSRRVPVGIGIFSRKLPFVMTSAYAYVGNVVPVRDLDGVEVTADGDAIPNDVARVRETESRLLAVVEVEMDQSRFRIGTTHGPWVPGGRVDDHQRSAVARMVEIVRSEGALVMAGDFNICRGSEVYDLFTGAGFKDCVPADIKGTRNHLAAHADKNVVVDYFFTIGENYKVSDVETHLGVSDHAALSGVVKIEK
jgi:endonuclease/exonuclease/phosphatase family metal-dependent hydrolase